jgi:hypothetical protein
LFSFYRKDATSQRLDFISFLFTAKTLRRKGLLLLFSFYRKDAKPQRFAFTFARKDGKSQRFDFISFLLPQRRYVAKVY